MHQFRFRSTSARLQHFIWFVALLSMVETMLQAIHVHVQSSWSRSWLWFAGSALIGLGAAAVETIKRREEG